MGFFGSLFLGLGPMSPVYAENCTVELQDVGVDRILNSMPVSLGVFGHPPVAIRQSVVSLLENRGYQVRVSAGPSSLLQSTAQHFVFLDAVNRNRTLVFFGFQFWNTRSTEPQNYQAPVAAVRESFTTQNAMLASIGAALDRAGLTHCQSTQR